MILFITELSPIVQIVHIVQIVFLFFGISTEGLKTRVGYIQLLMYSLSFSTGIALSFAEEYKLVTAEHSFSE